MRHGLPWTTHTSLASEIIVTTPNNDDLTFYAICGMLSWWAIGGLVGYVLGTGIGKLYLYLTGA
jgi:hypothetical protein